MRCFTSRWLFAAFSAIPLWAANLQPSDNDPFFQYERLLSPATVAPANGRWTFQKTASRTATPLLLSGPYLLSQPGIAPEGHRWKALPSSSRQPREPSPRPPSTPAKPAPSLDTLHFDEKLPEMKSELRPAKPARTE